jgi:phosphatidate cytidylyltransferase
MHLKRWITALVAIPLLLLLIFKADLFVLTLIVMIVSILTQWEYFNIVFADRKIIGEPLLWLPGFLLGTLIIWAAYQYSSGPDGSGQLAFGQHAFGPHAFGRHAFGLILGCLVLALGITGFIALFRFKSDPLTADAVNKQMLCLAYIPLLLSHLLLIRSFENGTNWVFLVLLVVFAGDSGAFYIGKLFGKHKLCPWVSPGKTVEGAIGGIVHNILAGSAAKYLLLPDLAWLPAVIMFVIIGSVGQVGDLFESILKRSAGVKDSGSLLPGHGGFLDRIDALLFAAPAAFYYKEFFF